MSRFLHFAHMLETPSVQAGQYLHRGDIIGKVGSTGNSTGNHCHFECHEGRPFTWWFFPVGYALAQVQHMYKDPSFFLKNGLPVVFTRIGFGYLEKEKQGLSAYTYHPGIDLAAPAGTPIKAPCNGRVQFSEGTHWIKNLVGKLIPSLYNHGWGCHVWMECDEANLGL